MNEELKMIDEKLSSIMDWIGAYKQAKHNRSSEDDFTDDCLEIANYTRNILMLCVSLVPKADNTQPPLNQSQATVVGNAVRAYKIYDTIAFMFAEGRAEITTILSRLLIETIAKMKYLMKATDEERKRYVLESYKPVIIRYDQLLKEHYNIDLVEIETRMKEGYESNMINDNVTLEEIKSLLKESVFGTFEQLINKVMSTKAYDFAYRSGSEHVHGGWNDLTIYHLNQTTKGFEPKIDFEDPDTRYLSPLTILIIKEFIEFVRWTNCDPKSIIKPIMNELLTIATDFDNEHEGFICSKQNT